MNPLFAFTSPPQLRHVAVNEPLAGFKPLQPQKLVLFLLVQLLFHFPRFSQTNGQDFDASACPENPRPAAKSTYPSWSCLFWQRKSPWAVYLQYDTVYYDMICFFQIVIE